MKDTYHIQIHGWKDYESFRLYRIEHGIDFDTLVHTTRDDELIFDYVLDLTEDELLYITLSCRVVFCGRVSETT